MKLRPHVVLALLSAPAGLVALAAALPPWHWTMDLLACFPVQAAGTLWLAAALLSALRKWWLAAATGALAALATGVVLPGWLVAAPLHNTPQDVENTPCLRVMTLNLLRDNDKSYELLLSTIQNEAPDCIWCGEYTPGWQAALRPALADYPHRLELPDLGSFGCALFSRHPIERGSFAPLGNDWTPAGRAVLRTPSGDIGFLGVHPPPPQPCARAVVERDRALDAILQHVDDLPVRRIVLGDFNATPWNAAFARMREATGLGPGSTTSWLPTWPAQLPLPLRLPIDHVLVGGDLRVAEAHVGKGFGSDHLPLTATIVVPAR